MSTKYDLRYGSTTLAILINPYNIVAFPKYDNTKGRCCAYLPIGKVEHDENGNIIEFGNGTFDLSYEKYSINLLNDIIENKTYHQLIEENLIPNDIKEEDFILARESLKVIIDKRIINVE